MKAVTLLAFAALVQLVQPAVAQTPPHWPALAQQLQGVQPGSALERLIRQNQDFSLLRADELDRTRPEIPPWLKVFWRKNHPEATYSGADPTGGYPHVLHEVLEWMLSHQDLQRGKPAPTAAPELPAIASVSGEERISGAQSSPRSESDIRINYWNPLKIISASNEIVSGGPQAVFYSSDGGASWGQTDLPLFDVDAFHSDPTVDWSSDGRAWSATLGIVHAKLRLRNYVSLDSGATWTIEATPSGTQTNVDKEMIWVDHSAASACKDTQYAIWHNGNPAYAGARNPATGTWGAPIQVSGSESTGTAIGGDVKSNGSGDAFAFWPTTGNSKLLVARSTNCGVSWGTPVQIGTTYDSYDIGIPSMNNRRALIYIAGGAYRTATKNLAYAIWTDLTGATGCAAPANEPGSNATSTCKTRIWFARSTNGGANWQAKVMLNNQASKNDQFNPWFAVDESTGALGVMYYDTVDDLDRLKTNVYYQSSFDDGQTWSAPHKVTSAQTDETVAGADSGNQYGDYNGLSGYAGVFFPAWTDRRANGHEEIWTAKVSDPICTTPGVPVIGSASTPSANDVQVSWSNGVPAAAKFNVFRTNGTCAAPTAFAKIGSAVLASPYQDTAVSGGSSYAYKVSGVDATGICESAQSACVNTTATGICSFAPTFAGLASVSNAEQQQCTLGLAWSAGATQCAGPLGYNVYRGSSQNFVPGAGNRIASAVTGTQYLDSGTLANATTYYYRVRAFDPANGLEDNNNVVLGGVPTFTVSNTSFADTFEAASGFDQSGWTHQALSGAGDWTLSTAHSQSATHSWSSPSLASVGDRVLVSPSFYVLANTALSFFHTYEFQGSVAQCFDGGTLEISSDGGASWNVLPDAAFTAGGFNGSVNIGFSNPLGGKRAWCAGTIGTMTQVSAALGASYAGRVVKLRWHAGDDNSTAATGWFVDNVTIANFGTAAACSTLPPNSIFSSSFE